MTAAVWTRGILADQYGVQWQDLQWVVSRKQRFTTLPGVTLEVTNGDLEDLCGVSSASIFPSMSMLKDRALTGCMRSRFSPIAVSIRSTTSL